MSSEVVAEVITDIVVDVRQVGKAYPLYARPADRLLQMFGSFLRRKLPMPLARRHREFQALQNISVRIIQGETVGIIGRNGSGKSTLLQLLCGTLHASQGHIEVTGRIAALLELGSGFNPDFSGRENVFFNAAVLGLSREQTIARFAAIAAFADIGDFMDQPLKSYSSGMAMRLAFAVIAHVDADILIIDEALSVGDAFFTQKCMRYLRQFMKTGTVIFVSHDIEAVMALCSRVIWLNSGQISADGATKAVCQAYLNALLSDDGAAPTLATLPDTPARLNALATPEIIPFRDARQDLWNASTLRNDIRLWVFDPDKEGAGQLGCTIRNVQLVDPHGNPLSWIVGGEMVRLEVQALCHIGFKSPIVGFMVKDRTGQALFGDNTWLNFMEHPINTQPGELITATFAFDMPRLPSGDYTMVVAVADGTQDDNVIHHWLHDALQFQSVASNVSSGLIGIPMRDIILQASAID